MWYGKRKKRAVAAVEGGQFPMFEGQTCSHGGSGTLSIPLANLDEPDDKEREESEKEGQTGQEAPQGEHRCH
jgi:hypothetical protein